MEAHDAHAAGVVAAPVTLDVHRTVSTGLSPGSRSPAPVEEAADPPAASVQQVSGCNTAIKARQVTTNIVEVNAVANNSSPAATNSSSTNATAAELPANALRTMTGDSDRPNSMLSPFSLAPGQLHGQSTAVSLQQQLTEAVPLAGHATSAAVEGNRDSSPLQENQAHQQQQADKKHKRKSSKRPSHNAETARATAAAGNDDGDDDSQTDMQTVKRRKAMAVDEEQQLHKQHSGDHSHIRRHHTIDDEDDDNARPTPETETAQPDSKQVEAVAVAAAGHDGKHKQHAQKEQQHQQKRSKAQAKPLLSFTEEEDFEEPTAAAAGGSSSSVDVQHDKQQEQQQQQSKHRQLGGLALATASRFAQEIRQAAAAARMVFKPSSLGNSAPAAVVGANAAAAAGAVLVDEDVDMRAAATAAAALSQIHFGFATARGHRPYMEDRHTIITALNPATAAAALHAADDTAVANGIAREQQQAAAAAAHHDGVGRSYAAIFDGHNGAGAAETAARKLHLLLASHPALRLYKGETGPPAVVKQEEQAVGQALKAAFRQVDDLVLGVARRDGTRDGATALVLLRLGHALYSAHAGDSRAVLCRDCTAYRLTEDHKPHLPHERSRIEEAGGRVDFQRCWRVVVEPRDGRPGSGLAVSRSLGDLDFKEPYRYVECEPDVTRLVLQPNRDSFIILGSDGLWDVLSDTDAVITAAIALKNFTANHHNSAVGAGTPAGAINSTAVSAGVGHVGGRQRLHQNNSQARAAAAAGFATAELPDNLVYSDAAATAAAEALLAESMRRGTMDNVTVIVMLLQWS